MKFDLVWKIRKTVRFEVFNIINVYLESNYLDAVIDIHDQQEKIKKISSPLLLVLKKNVKKVRNIKGVEDFEDLISTKNKIDELIVQLEKNVKIKTSKENISKKNIYHSILNSGLFVSELYMFSMLDDLTDTNILDFLEREESKIFLGNEIRGAIQFKQCLFDIYRSAGFYKKSHDSIKYIDKYLKPRKLPIHDYKSNLRTQIRRSLVGTEKSYFRFKNKDVLAVFVSFKNLKGYLESMDIISYFRYEHFLLSESSKVVIDYDAKSETFFLLVTMKKGKNSYKRHFDFFSRKRNELIMSEKILDYISSNRLVPIENKTSAGILMKQDDSFVEDRNSPEYKAYKGII